MYLLFKQGVGPVIPLPNVNGGIDITPVNETRTPAEGSPREFQDHDEYTAFVKKTAASFAFHGYGGAFDLGGLKTFASPEAVASAPSQNTGESSQSRDYSTTNIQVAGVDEADIIKSDGEYLYIASGDSIVIVKAYPAVDSSIISTIKLASAPQQLFIADNRLIVYGSDNQIFQDTGALYRIAPMYMEGKVFVKVYDISDKTTPNLIRDVSLDGYAVQSRMVGDYAYLVTVKSDNQWMPPYPLPQVFENGKLVSGGKPGDESFTMPSVNYFPIPYRSLSMTSVTAINVHDAGDGIGTEVYMLDGNQNLYMSPENMYITYTQYLDQEEVRFEVMRSQLLDRVSVADKGIINDIENSPDHILNPYERRSKIMQVLERYISMLPRDAQETLRKQIDTAMTNRLQELHDELEKTVVHRIAVDGKSLTHEGSGEVPGYILNQFAMDENGDYFRIATTRSPSWFPGDTAESSASYNNVYVLNGNLEIVGRLENLAQGERIYAVRFMQNRAYLVTFEQVDPLFVIDLSEPVSPKVLGELKIPGFSQYLHPLNDVTLIGWGRETEVNQFGGVTTKGLKLSLFDVSDVSSPKEKAQYIIEAESADSQALYDHRAFLYSASKNLLVVPVIVWAPSDRTPVAIGSSTFGGAAVFTVTADTIALQGVIRHAAKVQPDVSGFVYDNQVTRSLYIEDTLYTLSQGLLKMNTIENLAEIKSLDLPVQSVGIPRPMPLIENGVR